MLSDEQSGPARVTGLLEKSERLGVPPGLHDVGPKEIQEEPLSIGKVVPAARARDPRQDVRPAYDGDAQLILDAEQPIEVVIEAEAVKLATCDEVGHSKGALVAGA